MEKDKFATYYRPPHLTCLAADVVIRLLVYEDYEDCNFYRWDPVRIWQYETPQPKKKKSKKSRSQDSPSHLNSLNYGHPPPPWKDVLKLRNWWCDDSSELLGHLIDSPIRHHIMDALERQSWSAKSEEEEILFLLLRLFMDVQLHFSLSMITNIPSDWCGHLSLIIDNLGPFPLQKFTIDDEIFEGSPGIIATIIQNSPNLQILRIGQWELNNDILFSIGNHCPSLQEFCISRMEPEVFMSDEALFKCFFNGMTPEEVIRCHGSGIPPRLSFPNLKYIDLLFCKQTERLIQMLAYFYPRVSLSAIDLSTSDWRNIAEPFLKVSAKVPFVRASSRTKGILDQSLVPLISHSSFMKEIRVHIDDSFAGAECDSLFHQKMNEAGEKLKEYIGQLSNMDSFVIRPHNDVNMIPVVLPSFSTHGQILKCIHFVYDLSEISSNTIYQLLNLCPVLEKLTISVSIYSRDVGNRTFITELRELPTLKTFIMADIHQRDEEDSLDVPIYISLAKDILEKAPNLKNLSFNCWEALLDNFILHSTSVEKLHLNFSGSTDESKALSYCFHWLRQVLPNFPRLQVLSLEGDCDRFWSECVLSLSKCEIIVTMKKQEFAGVYRWDDNANLNFKPVILVM